MSELILPDIIEVPFENKWLDITTDEYHRDNRAVHSSSLRHVLKSPHAYRHYIMNPKKPTNSMRFGRIAHELILEGSKFFDRFVVEPIFEGKTKDGKVTTSKNALSVQQAEAEWRNSLLPGTEVITQKDLDKLKWMVDSVTSHSFAKDILKDGVPEAKGVWVDPVTKLRCIFQPDFLSKSVDGLTEFKTTTDCSWYNFRRSVEDLRYDLQLAFYEEGVFQVTGKRPKHQIWIVTESEPPYETKVHEVHSCYRISGNMDLIKALNDIKHSMKTLNWPQAQNVPEDAPPPSPWFENLYTGRE